MTYSETFYVLGIALLLCLPLALFLKTACRYAIEHRTLTMIACKPLSLLGPLLLVGCTLGPDYHAAPDSHLQDRDFYPSGGWHPGANSTGCRMVARPQ